MYRRVLSHSLDHHIEQQTLHRSFDTLEAAQKFAEKSTAEGKTVIDIYRAKGRFKVEYWKTVRVDYDENGFPIRGKAKKARA